MRCSRYYTSFLRRSLRVKVTAGVVLPLLCILGIFAAIEYTRHRAAVLANLSRLAAHSGQVIEYTLRHELRKSNFAGVQGLINAVGASDRFRVVYVLDPFGRVIFAPHGEGVGRQLDYHQPDCQPCHRLRPEARPGSIVVTRADGQRVFRSMYPLKNGTACTACHAATQRVLGLLLTDIPVAPLEKPLAADLREDLLWWVTVILATVIIVNLAMSRLVLRRLKGIAQALARFDRRHTDIRVPTDSPDEIGLLATALNDMGQRIQIEEAENRLLSEDLRRIAVQRRELLKRVITAQEEERRRVARDLHDDLGQALAGLAVSLEVLERQWNSQSEPARTLFEHVRARIRQTSARAYDMILSLRPSALDDLGLVPALRMYAKRTLEAAGIQVGFEAYDLTHRLPPEIETALFRVFQEALNNIVRHAGARRVHIALAARDGVFEGEIADDGRGFDPSSIHVDGYETRGLGLLGMRERVALCGGTLDIDARPGRGTRLRVRIPLAEINGG